MIKRIKKIISALFVLTSWSLLLACGGSGSDESNPQTAKLTTPNAFNFAAQPGVALSSVITSAEVSVSGINTAVPIKVVGGEYSINNANFTAAASQVVNGDKVKVRHTSAATHQTIQETTLTIGNVAATFRSTTVGTAVSDLQVSVHFPLNNTKVYTDKITISGNASSGKGIANIRVNGINATFKTPVNMVGAMSTEAATTLTDWSVEVPLASASNSTLTVEATETNGTANEAAVIHISTQQPPINFAIDSEGRRLLGQVYSEDINELDIIAIDLTTGEYQVKSRHPLLYQPQYISSTNSLLYSTLYGHTYTLYSLSLDTGILSTLLSYSLDTNSNVTLSQLSSTYDAANNHLYVSFMRSETESTEYGDTELYRINLTNLQWELIASTDKGTGGKFYLTDLAIVGNNIIAIDSLQNRGLVSLNLANGNRTVIAPLLPYFPVKLAVHPEDTNKVFVAGLSGVATVNLSTGEVSSLSTDEDYPDYNLSQILSLAVDLPGNRLLIGESGFNYVQAIDLSSGERSTAYSAGVGEGRKMFSPTYLAYDTTSSTSYVWDYSTNNSPALLKINMVNGHRTLLAEIDGIGSNYAGGLHLDKNADRLILQYPGGVVAYNLGSTERQTLASDQAGTGPLLEDTTSSVFDEKNNVLWVTAKPLINQLYRISLNDLSRELITLNRPAGSSDDISGLTKLELDNINNRLFMANSDSGKLYQLNLTDMSAALLDIECKDMYGRNMLDPDSYYIGNMHYDSFENDLFITLGGLIKWDLDTQSCNVIRTNNSVFDLTITPERRVIATRENRLMQLDIINNQEVVISR
ncbi:hypothetical protein [Rheinheimera oceanensis]|uniref:hypothetical protein n=1 Tax=Rheinheimera oceanensis TaxID=2817449 RepID=UPI001BFD0B53|nr:hypothetical protein [Rheinheimera oceanensis]